MGCEGLTVGLPLAEGRSFVRDGGFSKVASKGMPLVLQGLLQGYGTLERDAVGEYRVRLQRSMPCRVPWGHPRVGQA